METNQKTIALFSKDGDLNHIVSAVCKQEVGFELTCHKTNFDNAIAKLKSIQHLDVLMVSVETSDLTRLDLLAQVTPPETKVILIGDDIGVGQYRELIQIGVSDYIPNPIDPTSLRNLLQHVAGKGSKVNFNQGVAHLVTGTSGGVGTSTLAANLAYGLAKSRKTVLVDFNTTHSQHPILLGCDYAPSLHQLAQDIERIDGVLLQQFSQKSADNLYLIYSEHQPEFSVEAMGHIVEKLRQHFGYVVVDLPSHLLSSSKELFGQVDNVLLVHDYSLQAGRKLDHIVDITKEVNAKIQVIGNQSRAKNYKPWEPKQLFEAHSLSESFSLPYDGRAIAKSEQSGKNLIEQGGKLSKAISKLKVSLAGGK